MPFSFICTNTNVWISFDNVCEFSPNRSPVLFLQLSVKVQFPIHCLRPCRKGFVISVNIIRWACSHTPQKGLKPWWFRLPSLPRVTFYSKQSLVKWVEPKHKREWGTVKALSILTNLGPRVHSQKWQVSQVCVMACGSDPTGHLTSLLLSAMFGLHVKR